MAWWSRKVRRRPERPRPEIDLDLDTSLVDAFPPPQLETLFDADEYVADFTRRDPESEWGMGAGPEPTPEPTPTPAPTPVTTPTAAPCEKASEAGSGRTRSASQAKSSA